MNHIKPKLTQSSNQKLALFQIIALVLITFNLFVSCSNSGKISRINKKQVIGVQLNDGEVVTGETVKVNHRSDETITSFVRKLAYLSFNWKTSDLKVTLNDDKAELPGNAYASTFAYTSRQDFRSSYSQEFAKLISEVTENESGIQSAIRVSYISPEPVKIKDGIWEVILISTWEGMNGEGKQVFSIPFNKKLRLKATPIGGKTGFIPTDETTQLQTIIDEISRYGLTVTRVESYDPE